MLTKKLSEVEKSIPQMQGAEGVHKQVPLSVKDGVPVFSFRVFTIAPGGHTPYHQHPFEHMNYVIEGSGVLVSADKEHELNKGDFALVLPDEMHQFRNTGKSDLVIICAVPKEYE
ncbi:MAG: cupin domain-containing protein [Dehalococcoidia bacterium]